MWYVLRHLRRKRLLAAKRRADAARDYVEVSYADLVALVNQLNRTKGDAQWNVIRTNFNVEEVLTYFAVSSLTAYWDGFFNNYFTYH